MMGFEIKRSKFRDNHLKVVDSGKVLPVKPEIVDTIFNFFERVAPFYDDNIRPELAIKGAWKKDFEERRKSQIKIILAKDKIAYSKLISLMFKNELIAGQWDIEFFSKGILGNDAPKKFLYALERFNNITGLDASFLNDGLFGGKWGVDVSGTLLTYVDPYKGVNAFNSSKIIDFLSDKNALYLDLGSGFGSDAIKVEKFSKVPVRSILIDLPLNLTTAYAYVSMNTNKKCTLISDVKDLNFLLDESFSSSEFIFVPTTLVEPLSKLNLQIDLMYNHGSFSEMDYETIQFYLNTLLNGKVRALFEINSNESIVNFGGVREVKSIDFPVPSNYKLVHRVPALMSYFDHRYVESLYFHKKM